jgi:hypothetical protein
MRCLGVSHDKNVLRADIPPFLFGKTFDLNTRLKAFTRYVECVNSDAPLPDSLGILLVE